MIWLTWRQFRTQAWVAAAILAAAALLLLITGLQLAHMYDTSGIPGCHAHGTCQQVARSFVNSLRGSRLYSDMLVGTGVILLGVPGVTGVFWGAPLITREIEAGTFRLAWNQSVTRTRWLAAKLGLVGLASIAVTGLLSLMVTWWDSPVQRVAPLLSGHQAVSIINRLDPPVFSTHGIVPFSYAAFAFALGVMSGVLIRRTVPAMATTLAVFAGVQAAWPIWVRPHLFAPVHSLMAFDPAAIDQMTSSPSGNMTVVASVNLPNAWVLGNQTVTAAGRPFTGPAPQACTSPSGSFQQCQAGLGRMHLQQLVTYQPASRYWPFQWYEGAVFLGLALVLAGFCFWWVSRRRLA
jgi:ABC-2 family transporter